MRNGKAMKYGWDGMSFDPQRYRDWDSRMEGCHSRPIPAEFRAFLRLVESEFWKNPAKPEFNSDVSVDLSHLCRIGSFMVGQGVFQTSVSFSGQRCHLDFRAMWFDRNVFFCGHKGAPEWLLVSFQHDLKEIPHKQLAETCAQFRIPLLEDDIKGEISIVKGTTGPLRISVSPQGRERDSRVTSVAGWPKPYSSELEYLEVLEEANRELTGLLPDRWRTWSAGVPA